MCVYVVNIPVLIDSFQFIGKQMDKTELTAVSAGSCLIIPSFLEKPWLGETSSSLMILKTGYGLCIAN